MYSTLLAVGQHAASLYLGEAVQQARYILLLLPGEGVGHGRDVDSRQQSEVIASRIQLLLQDRSQKLNKKEDSPDCLPILLSISVFSLYSSCSPLLVFRAVD